MERRTKKHFIPHAFCFYCGHKNAIKTKRMTPVTHKICSVMGCHSAFCLLLRIRLNFSQLTIMLLSHSCPRPHGYVLGSLCATFGLQPYRKKRQKSRFGSTVEGRQPQSSLVNSKANQNNWNSSSRETGKGCWLLTGSIMKYSSMKWVFGRNFTFYHLKIL